MLPAAVVPAVPEVLLLLCVATTFGLDHVDDTHSNNVMISDSRYLCQQQQQADSTGKQIT
jgi:hypothetical protein